MEFAVDVSDGTSVFSNRVYVGYEELKDTVSELDTFKEHVHGGLFDMRFGRFGPEFANGAFRARFHFPKPDKLYISCKQQSDFEEFGSKNVASEATLYLKTEPALLDNFIDELKAWDANKREDARLEGID